MLRGYSTDTRLQQKAKRTRGYISPVPVGGQSSPPGPWGPDPRQREKKRPSDAGSGPRRPSKSGSVGVPDTPADIQFNKANRAAGMRKIETEETCVVPREQKPPCFWHKGYCFTNGPLLPWGTDPRPASEAGMQEAVRVARVASSPQLSRNGSQSARGTPTGMSRRSGSDGRLERPPETPSSAYREQRDVSAMVSARSPSEPEHADIVYRKGRGVRNGYEKFHAAAQSSIKDVIDSEKAATIGNEQYATRRDPARQMEAGVTSARLTHVHRAEAQLGETVKVSRNHLTDPILHTIEIHGMLEDSEYGGAAGVQSIRQTELNADYPLNPGVFAPKARTDPLGHKSGKRDLPAEKKAGLRTFQNKPGSNIPITDRMPKRESMQVQAAEKPRRESGQRAAENRPGTPGSMSSLTSSRWR